MLSREQKEVTDMSTEVALIAVNPNSIRNLGKLEYRAKWLNSLEHEQPAINTFPEGRLIIGCSITASLWILRALDQPSLGLGDCTTDEDSIYCEPEILHSAILRYWREWHEEDERWAWSRQTIQEFFDRYKYAIIYVEVL